MSKNKILFRIPMPASCNECPFNEVCGIMECGEEYCTNAWHKMNKYKETKGEK